MTGTRRTLLAGAPLAAVLVLAAGVVLSARTVHATIDGGYVGTTACLSCHDGTPASDKTTFLKTGHPWKYRHTGGAPPTDPLSGLFPRPFGADIDTATLGETCGDGLVVCDGDLRLDWSAINYTIGGYGWKIRWGVKDPTDAKTGYVWTGPGATTGAQYNIENGSWSAYNAGTDKKNECATCHQTNGSVFTSGYSCYTDPLTSNRSEPLLTNAGMALEEINSDPGGNDDGICDAGESCKIGGYRSQWTFDGVQCEACHGKGSNALNNGHADLGVGVTQGVLTLPGSSVEICAQCHIRAENTNSTGAECGGDANPAILINGAKSASDYINHHEQYNELVGLTCAPGATGCKESNAAAGGDNDGTCDPGETCTDGVHTNVSCSTCHNPHKRAAGVISAVATALSIAGDNTKPETGAIKVGCESCHAGKTLRYPMGDTTCVDCHMGAATKSATAESGTWGKNGDVKTHIFKIDPAQTTLTRSNGQPTSVNVAKNALSVKYACGKCHDSSMSDYVGYALTEAQAQEFALNMHDAPPPVYPVTFSYLATGLTVNVSASVTCSGPCPALTYDWDWGDGTAHGSGATTSHGYATAGTKSITLTVRVTSTGDRVAGSVTRSLTLYAPDNPPTVGGTACGSIFTANTWTASLTDSSTDDHGILFILVDWGDGSMLSRGVAGATLPHTYRRAGSYVITQRAVDTALQASANTPCTVSPATFTISGTVKSNGGANLGSARVIVTNATTGALAKTVYSAAVTGAFSATALKPGTYRLTVVKRGYTFPAPAATITVGPSSAGNTITADP